MSFSGAHKAEVFYSQISFQVILIPTCSHQVFRSLMEHMRTREIDEVRQNSQSVLWVFPYWFCELLFKYGSTFW